MLVVLLTLLGSLVTSFIGSFLCFIIWVHFNFDERWAARKEEHHLADIRRGFDLENERRMRHGQRPLPETERP